MAVIGIELHWKGATGNQEGAKRTYAAVYRLYTDNGLDGPQVVLDYFYTTGTAPGGGDLPNPTARTTYAYGNDADVSATCKSLSAPQHVDKSANVWEITVNYDTEQTDPGGGGGTDKNGKQTNNPLDFRPDITESYVMVQRPVYLATYQGGFTKATAAMTFPGSKMTPMSSARRPYDPPIEMEVPLKRISVTLNTKVFDDSLADLYINRVNSLDMQLKPMEQLGYGDMTWLIKIKKGTAKLNDYKPVIKRESVEIDGVRQVIDYLAVTAEMLIDPNGWRDIVPDRDFHRFAGAGAPNGRGGTITMTEILDGMPPHEIIRGPGGDPAKVPVFLDGDGQPLRMNNPGEIVYITWSKYEEKPLFFAPVILETFVP